jgi:hypothetical protein
MYMWLGTYLVYYVSVLVHPRERENEHPHWYNFVFFNLKKNLIF